MILRSAEPLAAAAELDVDDLPHVLAAERVEHDDLVDAVEELRAEVLAAALHHLAPHALVDARRRGRRSPPCSVAADVRRHDDDGVLEVDRPALAVGQPAVVEHLQQHVEHFRMRLLDLVEQHHAVGPPPHRLGQLAALFVADVAGRRADQPRRRCASPGTRTCRCGSSPARRRTGTRPARAPARSCRRRSGRGTGSCRADGSDPAGRRGRGGWRWPRRDRLVLADDALVQPLLHLQQLLDLALHQPADRDAASTWRRPRRCPPRRPPPSACAGLAAVGSRRLLARCNLLLELGHAAVLQLRRLGVVARRAARARSPAAAARAPP